MEGPGLLHSPDGWAYRAEATSRLLVEQAERAALVDGLLTGRALSQTTLWEIAELLRLPASGPFVVVAARSPQLGRAALPAIEARLRAASVDSAWVLMLDVEAGIVHVPGTAEHAALDRALGRHGDRRIGMSLPYSQLAGTAQGDCCSFG